MKRVLFALVLVLFAGQAWALSVTAPTEVATNTAFSVGIQFDSLDSFSVAVVQVDGTTVVSLTAVNSKLYVESVEKSRVLNLREDDVIDETSLYLLIAGFDSKGDRTISVEETGKETQSATVSVFIPASKDFEETFTADFASLKSLIMSYADDIDDLKDDVDELNSLVAAKASASELQSKLAEISSKLDGVEAGLESSIAQTQDDVDELQATVNEQSTKLSDLEEETDELTSTGFISFGALQGEAGLAVIGLIIAVVVVAALASKGKLSMPKLPVSKKKEKSVYSPTKKDEEIASQVLEEASQEEDPEGTGKWAFKGGSWKPEKKDTEKQTGNLGNLIKRD